MPKKFKNLVVRDVTINDSANSLKPVHTVRNAASTTEDIMLESWDDINEEMEIIEETIECESEKFSPKKKKSQNTPTEDEPGVEYPEIVFYLISRYIEPAAIGKFALINKAAYAVTKNKSFWMLQFKRHCENHPKLPDKLRTDSFKAYGLRQTVIKSLYLTYEPFIQRIATSNIKLNSLLNRICVNSWVTKGLTSWNIVFKLKKKGLDPIRRDKDLIEELGRVDANTEEGTQVLLVTCKNYQVVPALMGMTLTSASMPLSQDYSHHKLRLGFNTSLYAIRGIMPEQEVIIDNVVAVLVCDWWHPRYPEVANLIPRQNPPLLRKSFFEQDFP